MHSRYSRAWLVGYDVHDIGRAIEHLDKISPMLDDHQFLAFRKILVEAYLDRLAEEQAPYDQDKEPASRQI